MSLGALSANGVSIWLDDLSRTRIESGSLAKSVAEDSVVGVTTNPTIFAAALAEGSGYEDQLSELSLIHISEPTRLHKVSRMPSSA